MSGRGPRSSAQKHKACLQTTLKDLNAASWQKCSIRTTGSFKPKSARKKVEAPTVNLIYSYSQCGRGAEPECRCFLLLSVTPEVRTLELWLELSDRSILTHFLLVFVLLVSLFGSVCVCVSPVDSIFLFADENMKHGSEKLFKHQTEDEGTNANGDD